MATRRFTGRQPRGPDPAAVRERAQERRGARARNARSWLASSSGRVAAGLALLFVASAAAAQSDDAPCTDGVFSGDVGDVYRQILEAHAARPSGSFLSTLPAREQAIVRECAGKSGPDLFRYRLREVIETSAPFAGASGQSFVLGHLYEHLDRPATVCDPTSGACTERQYYYLALVLSGCYADNAFAGDLTDDEAYLRSAGWVQGHPFDALRRSDMAVLDISCPGDPGIRLQPLAYDLVGTLDSDGAYRDEGGELESDPDANRWSSQAHLGGGAGATTVGTLPPAFEGATSTVWNMSFSRWDPSLGGARAAEATWKSPFVDPAALCGSTGCQLGYASTWWDPEHRWEWRVVYEFRWDVTGCDPIDPGQWHVGFDALTHASPPKERAELCTEASRLGAITVIKSTRPDPGTPWANARFEVQGPTPAAVVLQDPGASECTDGNAWSSCGAAPPWDHEDRATFRGLVASQNDVFDLTHLRYRIIESGGPDTDLAGYQTRWACRNVDPETCTASALAALAEPFTEPACAPVAPPAACGAQGWLSGAASGNGTATSEWSLCPGATVVCQFTNIGAQACLESQNAAADLRAFGGAVGDPAAFASAAVPVRSGGADDSLFLASFTPLPDTSRWPGSIDHFILPLPVVENADGDLVPNVDAVCPDHHASGCLAWRGGDEILAQAPDATEVAADRRIGTGPHQRRVTYTSGDVSARVPRSVRPFDHGDADALADEHDLWNGLGLPYLPGNAGSEAIARARARAIIEETLRIREVPLIDPEAAGGTRTVRFVAGDVFHSDPRLVAGPQNVFYLANDLEGNGKDCADTVDPNRGYRCFFERHRRRSRILLAASNDGQIHAFDAGRFHPAVVDRRLEGKFDHGTGREVFAHIPRPMLEHTRAMTEREHDFGIDGGITVDDVFLDPIHDGTPTATDREWRTVAIGTYREGARGLWALDVTQPDPVVPQSVLSFAGQPDVEWVPERGTSYVPRCSSLHSSPPAGCGPLPYPAMLWEFSDRCAVTDGTTGTTLFAACDDDANGQPDLGFTWSTVNTGRIRVNVEGGSDPVMKFVAVFGGGLDPENEIGTGNFLYMVDVETGKTLYKRKLDSAAPSEPAAVDTDRDGVLDRIFIGTVDGLLYKVDLSTPADLVAATGRIQDPGQWEPFPIFDTGDRPIFLPPTVTYVASQGSYALAFGTGDREDLFGEAQADVEGRFYMVVDTGFAPDAGVLSNGPLTEASFEQIDRLAPGISGDLLTAPLDGRQPGWVLRLGAGERVVTKAVTLSGLLVFTTFDPETPSVCEYGGVASIYGLRATNASSIAGIDEPRAITVDGFAGQPIVIPSGLTQSAQDGQPSDPFDVPAIRSVRRSLMDLFPADCRFGSFSLNIGVELSNTSQVPIASVPVCVVRRNWTELF